MQYEIEKFDPHARTTISSWSILSNFYESLVIIDSNMRIQPCLARGWENPDVYTWIFHLQPAAHFHNGARLTANDVVYSIERLLKSTDLDVSSYLTEVVEVQKVDPMTVKVRTKNALPIFLNRLSNIAIVPDGSTGNDLKNKENGTGPYKLVAWKDNIIRLERDDRYWGKKAALRYVNYYLKQTPEEAVKQLQAGKFQFIQYDSKKLEPLVRKLGHYQILRQDNYYLKHLGFDVIRTITPYCNVKPNPFRNPLVREAIYHGIDRNKLIADLPTYAVIASQPVPPFVFGFNPRISPPAYAPDQARQLLAKAGVPDGFRVTLDARQILQETALLLKDQLGKIGIQIDLKILPDSEFFKILNSKEDSFFLSRVGATVGDASDILEPQIHSTDAVRHYGVRNYTGYVNLAVDKAIEDSAGIIKVEDRREALQEIMTVLMKDLPWIPLYIDQDVYALDNSFIWHPRHDSFVFAYEIGFRD